MSAVDVLAVLDADVERQRIGVAAGHCDPDAMAEFEQARAAVAKLIEAVEFATDMLAAGDVSEGTRVRVYVALHNALARVWGAK